MTFKTNWEKSNELQQLPAGTIEGMVRQAYPDRKLISQDIIFGGCANLNIKITLEDAQQPLIVRVYLRDKEAAYREQKLGAMLKQTVPIPVTHYVGDQGGYRFAIVEFLPGITLR